MTLIIILNAVFAAFVIIGIIGLHLYAIAKDHVEHAAGSPVRAATRPGVARAGHRTGRSARRAVGAVSLREAAAGGQAGS